MNSGTSPLVIGDIVALKSNPLFEGLSNVIISGDCETLSPLMVVAEILLDYPKGKDQGDGLGKPVQSCKCIWYSHKSWQFEEAWLSSALLKKVRGKGSDPYVAEAWSVGTLVSLSTLDIELGKRKSFLQYEGNDADDRTGRSTIHHFHSFLSPVMHVLEVRDHVPKKNQNATKANPNLIFPKKTVKCKWFNADSEKMTEAVLPMDALTIIQSANTEMIRQVDQAIKNRSVCLITNKGKQACARPLDIVYRSGLYFVRVYDYIENRVFEIEPCNLGKTIEGLILEQAPIFDLSDADPRTSYEILQGERLECIARGVDEKSYMRIKYLNTLGKAVWRTVSDYKVFSLNEDKGKAEYLMGHCHTKKETRTFRVDRILKMELLSLSFVDASIETLDAIVIANGMHEGIGGSKEANILI